MLGKKIFKRDTGGKIRVWQFEVDGNRWRTHAGLLDGAIVESGWTTCEPRSRPTAEAQALFEAEAEMGKKLERDYSPTIEGVDDERAFGADVMLAHAFDPKLFVVDATFAQPKLDGMRCKINRHGMWSRKGKPIPSCPHIFAALAATFAANPTLELDGELYNHDLKDDFPRLMSILRKTKPTEADLAEAARLAQYHVYDVVRPDLQFSERDRILELFVQTLGVPEIVKVPTVPVASLEQLDAAYATFLEDGYEGQIVRLDGPYEHKRSKGLLKRKEFITREFDVIAVEPGNGNWAGLAKRIRFRLDDGRECGGGIRGTRDQMKALLDGLTPKRVTMRYFTPSPDGMPRFPVAIDFDRPDEI